MNKTLRRFTAWVFLAGLTLVAAACGGGGGEGSAGTGTEGTVTISGVAMKGPIKGAWVGVYQLKSDGSTGDLLNWGTSGNGGLYDIKIPASRASGPLLVVVKGQAGATYLSETSQKDVAFANSTESFNAIVNAADVAQGVTIGPLTEAAYQKLQEVLTTTPTLKADTSTINLANQQVGALFKVTNILAAPSSDPAYTAALTVIDQMVVNSKSTSTGAVMNVIVQAVATPTLNVAAPSYVAFQQAVTAAATAVTENPALIAANPTLAAAVTSIQNSVTTPPNWTDTTAPTAPLNLSYTTSVLTATSSSITLSWSPSTDDTAVTGYDIYRDNTKIATVTTTTHYTDPALAHNATYNYYVVAFDRAGNRSVASNQVSVPLALSVSDTTPPTQPSNLSASTFLTSTTASVVLLWSPSSDNKAVTGYDVYRDGSKVATVDTPGFTDPLVALATTYSYYIVAFDGAGNRSVESSHLSVTPNRPSLGVIVNGQLSSGIIGQPKTDVVAPTAPSNLVASTFAQTANTSNVVLTWSPSTDNVAVTGYEVYRNGSRIGTVTTPGYTDQSLTSNITYTYFIIAIDAAGNRSIASNQLAVTPNQASLGVTINGQLSGGVTGQPQIDVTAPTAPLNLTAVTTAISATSSSVLLAWSPSTDNKAVTGYDIYRNGSKIGTSVTPAYSDPSVTSNVTYNYYIIAFDAAGNRSVASSLLAVTPNQASLGVTINGQLSGGVTGQPQIDITAPTAPLNLAASTTGITATTSSVLLTWSPSTDNRAVTGYDIYRNGSKIGTSVTPAYNDPLVTSNVIYNYYVIAFDAAGNRSIASSLLAVKADQASLGVTINGQLSGGVTGQPQIDITPPTAPLNLAASTTGITATTSSVLLTWSPSTDNRAVTGYDIYRNGSKIGTSVTPVCNDPLVTSNVTYNYYVIAFDAAGNRSLASSQLAVKADQASLGVTVNGQLSDGVTGQTQQDITAPSAPTDFTATASPITATTSSVTLSWSPSTDNRAVTGYNIYRNGTKISTVTALGYKDPLVTSSVSYIYYVVAFDAAGNLSPASIQLSVTPASAALGVVVSGQISSSILGF